MFHFLGCSVQCLPFSFFYFFSPRKLSATQGLCFPACLFLPSRKGTASAFSPVYLAAGLQKCSPEISFFFQGFI
jgi:hypothetical protein